MTIGGGVFLLALGAILAFAVEASFQGIDLALVGWILMVAGALGVVFGALVQGRGDRATVIHRREL